MLAFSKQRWLQIQSLMDDVFDLPYEQQLSLVRQKCQFDPELFTAVQSLLQAEHQAPKFLDQGAVELAAELIKPCINTKGLEAKGIENKEIDKQSFETQPQLNNADWSGQFIGPYRLCEVIGRGGMGVVFRAERSEGNFDQQVAIKLLSPDKMSATILERFQREQQLLASLIHPGIAQLYDGGTTEQGQAYFVMEYVAGVPIHQYCDQQRLSIDQRLSLILQVAKALSFAHQHLIVHRDIKPGNILVNQQGQVKLLDFGIAKLLKQQENLDLTRAGEQLMTPGFAAPEQLLNQKITVATDIYQLGLIMYEMLTGHKAYYQYQSFSQLVKVICEQRPMSPSQLVRKNSLKSDEHTDHKAAIENSRLRSTRVHPLTKKLTGDLDAIALKMLDNKPEQRYPSMEAFSADLDAYFNNRPLVARSPTLLYQLTKFAQRQYKVLTIALLFVSFLIAYSYTSAYQAEQTRLALIKSQIAQDKSQRVSQFLVQFFKAADPNVAGLEALSAKDVLEKGHMKIIKGLNKVPEIQVHMLTLLGEIYLSQGDIQTSIELLQDALARSRKTTEPDNLSLANTLTQLGIGYIEVGQYDKALPLFNESLLRHQQMSNENSTEPAQEYGETLAALGQLYYSQGEFQQAEQYLNQAIGVLQRFNNGEHAELGTVYNNLAIIEHLRGNFDSARALMAKAITIQQVVLGEKHSYYSLRLVNFALMLTEMAAFTEAENLLSKALVLQQALLGNRHPYIAAAYRALGVLKYKQGQLPEAEKHLRASLKIKEQQGQGSTMANASAYMWLGAVLQDKENFPGAKQSLEKMMKIFRAQTYSGDIIGRGLTQMASLALAQNLLEQAGEHYIHALDIMAKDGIRITFAQVGYAQLLLLLDQAAKAEPLLRIALRKRLASYPADHNMVAQTRLLLGLALYRQGQELAAFPLLSQGVTLLNKQALFQFGNRRALLEQGNKVLTLLKSFPTD